MFESCYDKYVLVGNDVYEIIERHDLGFAASVFSATSNSDGTINFHVMYYNGGCCLSEAIGYAIENMEDNTQENDRFEKMKIFCIMLTLTASIKLKQFLPVELSALDVMVGSFIKDGARMNPIIFLSIWFIAGLISVIVMTIHDLRGQKFDESYFEAGFFPACFLIIICGYGSILIMATYLIKEKYQLKSFGYFVYKLANIGVKNNDENS